MSVLIKQGVCGDLDPVMQKALNEINKLYIAFKEDLIITSKREGNHRAGSLHYIGRAVDIRPGHVPIDKIRYMLGKDFDCIDESNHYHIEYDPN